MKRSPTQKWTAVISALLLVSCAGAWALTLYSRSEDRAGYDVLKAQADTNFEKQIYGDALEEYRACLETNPEDLDCLARVAEIYSLTGEDSSCIAWCERVLRKDPGNVKIGLLEARSYDNQKKVSSAISVLRTLKKQAKEAGTWSPTEQGPSAEAAAFLQELKGRFELNYLTIEEVGPWFTAADGNQYATVSEGNTLSLYSAAGKKLFSGTYTFLGQSADDKLLFPAEEEGQYFYVNEAGGREQVPDASYSALRSFSEGLAPAVKRVEENGAAKTVAGYLDENLAEKRFDFQETYPMAEGSALVKKDNAFLLLNADLQEVSACPFTDIKKDIYGNAVKYGLLVGTVSSSENASEIRKTSADQTTPEHPSAQSTSTENAPAAIWAFFQPNGTRIGTFSAEDLKLPESKTGYIAFQKEGLWGFVDRNGLEVISPQFEDACSFSKGLAAVKQDGKWGYIDKSGTFVIEPQFEEARAFSEQGTAFVKNHAGFSLLTLSRYKTA